MTPKAEADLDHILRYLLSVHTLNSAENALFAIREKINGLREFPHGNPIFHATRKRKIEYRYVIAKKVHRIIYKIEEVDGEVLVTGIVHVRSDSTSLKVALEEEE